MIYVTGDTHGGIDIRKFTHHIFNKEDYLIILGDFGFIWETSPKFYSTELARVYLFSSMVNCTVLFVDGNHENFDRLNKFPVIEKFGGKVHEISNNCYHLMRGEVYEIEGLKFLAIGGAESHDKQYRKEGISWWEEESITEKDINNAIKNLERVDYRVDFVVSHCLPTCYRDKFFITENIPFSAYEEKHSCDLLEKLLKKFPEPPYWLSGHYHFDVRYENFSVLFNKVLKIKSKGGK